jgi:arylformamidase
LPLSLLDVSRPLVSAMSRAFVYPPPVFESHVIGTQPNGEPITATQIEMYSHVGTHIESPRHLYRLGRTLDTYPLDRFIGPGRAFDLTGNMAGPVGVAELTERAAGLEPDSFVLLRLGNSIEAGTQDGPHAYLSDEAAQWLVERGVRGVGVDTSTPDKHVSERANRFDLPVHRILFAADVLIIENLGGQLADACGRSFSVHAVPLHIPGSDSSPVRVIVDLGE